MGSWQALSLIPALAHVLSFLGKPTLPTPVWAGVPSVGVLHHLSGGSGLCPLHPLIGCTLVGSRKNLPVCFAQSCILSI